MTLQVVSICEQCSNQIDLFQKIFLLSGDKETLLSLTISTKLPYSFCTGTMVDINDMRPASA
jgi:hypothetical protein